MALGHGRIPVGTLSNHGINRILMFPIFYGLAPKAKANGELGEIQELIGLVISHRHLLEALNTI